MALPNRMSWSRHLTPNLHHPMRTLLYLSTTQPKTLVRHVLRRNKNCGKYWAILQLSELMMWGVEFKPLHFETFVMTILYSVYYILFLVPMIQRMMTMIRPLALRKKANIGKYLVFCDLSDLMKLVQNIRHWILNSLGWPIYYFSLLVSMM